MYGARRQALQSNEIGPARRGPHFLSVSVLARIGILAAALLVPLDQSSQPNTLCEEFSWETIAKFVEQVLHHDGDGAAAARPPEQFEASALDRVLSGDCSGRAAR